MTSAECLLLPILRKHRNLILDERLCITVCDWVEFINENLYLRHFRALNSVCRRNYKRKRSFAHQDFHDRSVIGQLKDCSTLKC